jgi:hypothetical protein
MDFLTHLSPVVQIPPVGGPPRRSADKTPKPPPVVRKKKLQVASSTGGREAQNKHVVQVLVTDKRVRNTRLYTWESPNVEQNEHASSPNTRPEMTSGEHDVFTVIRGGRATQRSRDRVLLRCARISDL